MFVNRTHGVVAATLGALSLGLAGCEDPAQNTDLRTEGPPDVLAVLVLTDAASQLYETATYCRPNDEKRPALVGLPDFTTQQVCPDALSEGADEVGNAYPDGWYVRIMFDELLDPSVEKLTEVLDEDGNGTDTYTGSIADSHPVTLRCESVNGGMVEVDYDGYYSPAGNRITWPVGPSLVIKPNDPTLIATSSKCEVTINDTVTDKAGNKVDNAQRGPYTFSIAPIQLLMVDPADSGDETDPTAVDAYTLYFDNPYLAFNTYVDVSSLCPDADDPATDAGAGLCDGDKQVVKFSPDPGGICNVDGNPCATNADCTAPNTHCDSTYAYAYDPTFNNREYGVGPIFPVETDKDYTFSFVEGAKLADRCGKELTLPAPTVANNLLTHYHTNKFDLKSITPADGETAAMTKRLTLNFNNVIDPASLEKDTEYTITPTPDSHTGATNYFGGDLYLDGNYAPDTTYTFTLKAGATVEDAYGVVYTNDAEQTITWKTQKAFTLSSISPANNGTVQKVAAVQPLGITLTFNSNIDTATVTSDDFTFVNAETDAPVAGLAIGTGANGANCTAGGRACQIRIRADLAPGTYKFTWKATASVTDKLGNVYTNTEDRIVNFEVLAPPSAPACL